jgi:hypothetical protein
MEPLIYDPERVKLFEGSLQALLSVRSCQHGENSRGTAPEAACVHMGL